MHSNDSKRLAVLVGVLAFTIGSLAGGAAVWNLAAPLVDGQQQVVTRLSGQLQELNSRVTVLIEPACGFRNDALPGQFPSELNILRSLLNVPPVRPQQRLAWFIPAKVVPVVYGANSDGYGYFYFDLATQRMEGPIHAINVPGAAVRQ